MIRCPECGSKISSLAKSCPYCGYQSNDPERPISEQDHYKEESFLQYDIIGYTPNRGDLSIISYEDNRNLIEYFGKWNNIESQIPSIAEVIFDMSKKEHYFIAKMDDYVKKLIDNGIFKFVVDKNGEILPTICNAETNQYVKQVRLENFSFSPNVHQSLNNLSMHAALAQVLDKIEYIEDAIRELHIELQNDRLAIADSAYDKIMQAKLIQDSRIRMMSIINAIQTATDAKRGLMRNFAQNLQYVNRHSNQSSLKQLIGKKPEIVNQKAIDAMQSLSRIANSVQIECEGYAALGEYKSARECLREFMLFIKENRLDNRDTLVLLNENATQKRIDIVNQFSDICQKISDLDEIMKKISSGSQYLLPNSKGEGEDENE